MSKKNGVVLMAFGSRQYLYMAAHLAMSIRHHSGEDFGIKLVHDHNVKYLSPFWRQFFSELHEIEDEHLYRDGRVDPGWAKCNIYEYASFDNNIYLDVDGLCLRDIKPLFNQDKFFATEVIGTGGKNDDIAYSWWATNEKIWEYFGLKEDGQYASIQSSFSFIKRGQKAKSLFTKIKKNFNYPKAQLQNHWGGTIPDELIVGGTCAQIEHNPALNVRVVFFGSKYSELKLHEIQSKYYITSLYGNGKGNTLVKSIYLDWYDRMILNICAKYDTQPIGKAFRLMKTKHAG